MEEIFALIGVVTLPFTVGLAVAWRMTRSELKRLRGGERSAAPPAADRFDRLEQSLDAIAVEVERISEGQRFTAKLLSDRSAPIDKAGAPPRI